MASGKGAYSQYAIQGAAEVNNWARAVLIMIPFDKAPDFWTLTAAKRHKPLKWKDADGKDTKERSMDGAMPTKIPKGFHSHTVKRADGTHFPKRPCYLAYELVTANPLQYGVAYQVGKSKNGRTCELYGGVAQA